jgi:hypothetical protein
MSKRSGRIKAALKKKVTSCCEGERCLPSWRSFRTIGKPLYYNINLVTAALRERPVAQGSRMRAIERSSNIEVCKRHLKCGRRLPGHGRLRGRHKPPHHGASRDGPSNVHYGRTEPELVVQRPKRNGQVTATITRWQACSSRNEPRRTGHLRTAWASRRISTNAPAGSRLPATFTL